MLSTDKGRITKPGNDEPGERCRQCIALRGYNVLKIQQLQSKDAGSFAIERDMCRSFFGHIILVGTMLPAIIL